MHFYIHYLYAMNMHTCICVYMQWKIHAYKVCVTRVRTYGKSYYYDKCTYISTHRHMHTHIRMHDRAALIYAFIHRSMHRVPTHD